MRLIEFEQAQQSLEADGLAKLDYNIPTGLTLGTHTITAGFGAHGDYHASVGTSTLTVK